MAIVPFTTVVGVDDQHAAELEVVWPTWRTYRPELLAQPLLLMCDAAKSSSYWESRLRFLQHSNRRVIRWDMHGVDQREKMLSALVYGPAQHVETPWYLKLDTDVVASAPLTWIRQEWFRPDVQGRLPVFISSPWSYTKPADAIERLDEWGNAQPAIKDHPPLSLPRLPGANCIRHRRIISWCYFGQTEAAREAAKLAPDRLPVPSQDTYLWYLAFRRRQHFVTFPMHKLGWCHAAGLRRLRKLSDLALSRRTEVNDKSSDGCGHSPKAISEPHKNKQVRKLQQIAAEIGRRVLRRLPNNPMGAILCKSTDACQDVFQSVMPQVQFCDPKAEELCVEGQDREPSISEGLELEKNHPQVAPPFARRDQAFDLVVVGGDHGLRQGLDSLLSRAWQSLRPGGYLCGWSFGQRWDVLRAEGFSQVLPCWCLKMDVALELGEHSVWVIRKA